jgi:hypothetical protein
MKRLRYLPHLIVYLGMLNFVLFFLSVILLGGDGLNGKVEAGLYYLGNHGAYTEVIYPVYLLSRLWGILFFVSFPLIMLAMILSWGVDYGDHNDSTDYVADLGKIYGFMEGFFSWLFDSWRKPDFECFTRLAQSECIQEVVTLPSWLVRDTLKKKAFNLFWGGQHFEVSLSSSSFWTWRGVSLVLHGHFQSTPHGTYVRAWYRWSTTNLLFLSIFAMFGLQFLLVGLEWLIVKVLGASQSAVVEFFSLIWPIWSKVSIVIGLLLFIAFSSWWGRHRRRELAHLVKEALITDS